MPKSEGIAYGTRKAEAWRLRQDEPKYALLASHSCINDPSQLASGASENLMRVVGAELFTPENVVSLERAIAIQKILVIEDGRALQRALKRLFEPEGFAVQIANDGLAALEYLKNARFDLVLLDLGLPGMSGRDACQQIRKVSPPALPIIVVSAKTDVWDKVLLLELGANDYVTKPFSPRELLARVRAALRGTQAAAATESSSLVRFLWISRRWM